MNKIKFTVSIDYQDVQTNEVMMMCKWIKHMLQFGKHDGKITDYTVDGIDSQEV